MASRAAYRSLCTSARQLARPAARQPASLVSALSSAARASNLLTPRATAASFQQLRGLKTVDFAGHKETVYGGQSFVYHARLTDRGNRAR